MGSPIRYHSLRGTHLSRISTRLIHSRGSQSRRPGETNFARTKKEKVELHKQEGSSLLPEKVLKTTLKVGLGFRREQISKATPNA